MSNLLIILCPPRSFSSVVSTMIGQHPELYGFPELHLFTDETVGDMLKGKESKGKPAPAGLVRVLAQEMYGVQTTRTTLAAVEWIREHQSWTTKAVMDHLLDLIHPRIGVEKSPGTSRKARYLDRCHTGYPDAYYLHLTRHPVSTRDSISEYFDFKAMKKSRRHGGADQAESQRVEAKAAVDALLVWYRIHGNILRFTNGLPAGQLMRIKGEDILSEPDVYLPQVAAWMGVSTAPEAIEKMKHPEDSPYAYTGPAPVYGGNDPKFMNNPRLRQGRIREPSLEGFLGEHEWHYAKDALRESLAAMVEEDGGTVPTDQEFLDEIMAMSHLMGYR